MSERLRRRIAGTIQRNEEQAIGELAAERANYDSLVETSVSEKELLREKATEFAAGLKRLRSKQQDPGILTRIRLRNTPKAEWYWEVNRNPHIRLASLENGIRTPIFCETTGILDDMEFIEGWQAGCVWYKQVHGSKLYGEYPVRIWRTARELMTQTVERELVYEISTQTGDITSFTDGERNDRYVTLADNAGSMALHLIGEAKKVMKL